jgi:hypothetical protein
MTEVSEAVRSTGLVDTELAALTVAHNARNSTARASI